MQVKSGFVASMERYFTNYVGFTGRAPRSDYWWPVLASLLVSLLAIAIKVDLLSTVWSIATIIPSLAVSFRRLHDVGRSAWWLLIGLTGIGGFVLLYWFIKRGDDMANKYGQPAYFAP